MDNSAKEAKRINDRERMREWRAANPEEAKARAKKHRESAAPEQKAAQAERMRKWREANKAQVKAYQEQWKSKNVENIAEYQQKYNAEYRKRDEVQHQAFIRNLSSNYGISHDDFNRMWEGQNGQCAVCGFNLVPRGRTKYSACVDHNHDTGEIRGLLCRGCNHGIGCLKDSPDVLFFAAMYLLERGHYGSIDPHGEVRKLLKGEENE